MVLPVSRCTLTIGEVHQKFCHTSDLTKEIFNALSDLEEFLLRGGLIGFLFLFEAILVFSWFVFFFFPNASGTLCH